MNGVRPAFLFVLKSCKARAVAIELMARFGSAIADRVRHYDRL